MRKSCRYGRGRSRRCRAAEGEDRPATFTAMANLAAVHESMGDFDRAEALWTKAWEGRQRTSGAREPYTLDIVARLAFARLQLKNYAETEPLLREAVAAQNRTNPHSWPRYNDELMLGAKSGRAGPVRGSRAFAG